MSPRQTTKALGKIDLSGWGTIVGWVVLLGSFLVLFGSNKADKLNTEEDVKNLKQDMDSVKKEQAQSKLDRSVTDAKIITLIDGHVLPKLTEIDDKIDKVNEKLDNHIEHYSNNLTKQ